LLLLRSKAKEKARRKEKRQENQHRQRAEQTTAKDQRVQMASQHVGFTFRMQKVAAEEGNVPSSMTGLPCQRIGAETVVHRTTGPRSALHQGHRTMIQMQFPAGERREIREIREKARETKAKVVVKHNKNLPPRP
jgi:hypothetical protein